MSRKEKEKQNHKTYINREWRREAERERESTKWMQLKWRHSEKQQVCHFNIIYNRCGFLCDRIHQRRKWTSKKEMRKKRKEKDNDVVVVVVLVDKQPQQQIIAISRKRKKKTKKQLHEVTEKKETLRNWSTLPFRKYRIYIRMHVYSICCFHFVTHYHFP